jgi:hypothetical protein
VTLQLFLAVGATSASSALGSQELRNAPGFLTLYSVSLPAEFFFAQNEDVLISVRSTA